MLRSEYGSTVFERQDEISQRILMLEHLCKQEHGYHEKCLKMFTNTARIKQKKRKAETQEVDEPEDNDSVHSPRKKKHSCLLPSDQCIFCHKRVKKHGNKFQKLVQLTSKEKASEIKDRAESVSQEHSHLDINIARRILSLKDIYLVAQEAMYHSACHSAFIPPPKGYSSFSGPSSSSKADNERARTSAHENATKFLCDYVNASIIRDNHVERISMLKEKYLQLQDRQAEE